jgi:hypothetical protein
MNFWHFLSGVTVSIGLLVLDHNLECYSHKEGPSSTGLLLSQEHSRSKTRMVLPQYTQYGREHCILVFIETNPHPDVGQLRVRIANTII